MILTNNKPKKAAADTQDELAALKKELSSLKAENTRLKEDAKRLIAEVTLKFTWVNRHEKANARAREECQRAKG